MKKLGDFINKPISDLWKDREFLQLACRYISSCSGSGSVDSVFGRTGDILAVSGDYDYSEIDNTPDLSVYEELTNKANDFSVINSTLYPTTNAVYALVNSAVSGLNPTDAVLAATTQASDTSGLTYNNGASGVGATLTGTINTAIVVDGVTYNTLNQRLLVKNDTQSPAGAINGIYYLSVLQDVGIAPVFTRAVDFDSPSDINSSGTIPVVSGTVNATTSWLLTSNVSVVGTDALTFIQFTLKPSVLGLLGDPLSQFAATTSSQLAGVISDETGSGALVFGTNPTIVKPQIDASFGAIGSYSPSGGGTATIDLSLNNKATINFPAGNITIALSNVSVGQCFLLRLVQDSGGSRTVTWFSTVKWANSTTPTLTTTANKTDVFGFLCTGSGTYDGFIIGQAL